MSSPKTKTDKSTDIITITIIATVEKAVTAPNEDMLTRRRGTTEEAEGLKLEITPTEEGAITTNADAQNPHHTPDRLHPITVGAHLLPTRDEEADLHLPTTAVILDHLLDINKMATV